MRFFPWLLFLVSIIVCLACAEDESYLFHICSGANYTSNTTYQKNLNRLLSSLSSNNDINYGFYNFSEGEVSDRVSSIGLCRGDVSQAACRRCVDFSTTDLPRRCPTQKEAIVWYDNCMFRYSNRSIFHSWENHSFYMWNMNNVSDWNKFNQSLEGLLSSLQERASSGDSRRKFAVGDAEYANSTRIYGLAQCTPDLTGAQCSNCLSESFGRIGERIAGKQGGRVIGPSCNFRFEINQFYEMPPQPPISSPAPQPSDGAPLPPLPSPAPQPSAIVPPPSPSPPAPSDILPPPPTATNVVPPPTGGGGSNKSRNIIIITISTVCFSFLLF
uniref:Gnk2-homologous domain-containing protein n=1 Tax=Kalanchoe fedtschenkoi TaxID=63787 RepID=A0A7N0TRI0_KALFE